MKSIAEIERLQEIMTKRYTKGYSPNLDCLIMPADAYQIADTLVWVLGAESGIDSLLTLIDTKETKDEM